MRSPQLPSVISNVVMWMVKLPRAQVYQIPQPRHETSDNVDPPRPQQLPALDLAFALRLQRGYCSMIWCSNLSGTSSYMI